VKILLYSRNWAPAVGGVETIVMSTARGLAVDRRISELILVTHTAQNGMKDSELPFRVIRRPGFFELFALLRAADVVHLAGPAFLPLLLALFLRKPTALEHHGFQAICPNGQLFYEPTELPCPGHFMAGHHAQCLRCNAKGGRLFSLKSWLLTFPRRRLCDAATANIMPTEWLSTQLKLRRSSAIHHGAAAPSARPTNIPARKVRFAYQGRLVTTKGVRVILEACGRLKSNGLSFELLIIGDGPNRSSLETLARKLEIESMVRFVGYLSPEELEIQMESVDAVLMPSLAGEVFGMVALENMLRGKLVVVSEIGALTEVIGHAGLACATADIAAWARCMERIVRDSSICSDYGARARERALGMFSTEQMVAKHADLYERILVGAEKKTL
jgi:glycogen synthase